MTADQRRDDFQQLVLRAEGHRTPRQELRQQAVQRHRRLCATWLAVLLAGCLILPTVPIGQQHAAPAATVTS